MKRYIFALWLIRSLMPVVAHAQEYSYTHYDITEGLAGSTVYALAQDKDGFLWASTETGVSRFDGTHFRNFTAADGLPDIEVLQLFGDSKGRVWMAPFKRSVCYYYRGRIHNQDNDSMLSSIHLGSTVQAFMEDSAGNLLIEENSAIHVVTPDGKVRNYDSIGGRPINECAVACLDTDGHFLIQIGERVVKLTDQGFGPEAKVVIDMVHPNFIALSPNYLVSKSNANHFVLLSLKTGRSRILPFKDLPNRTISLAIFDDSLIYFNQLTGSMEYNFHTGKSVRFLRGKSISRIFRDRDGNLWFSTMGQGIYRLSSDEFRTKVISTADAEQTSVHSIMKIGPELWIGNDHNQVYKLSLPGLELKGRVALTPDSKNRILYIDTLDRRTAFFAGDNNLAFCNRVTTAPVDEGPFGVKSVVRMDRRLLIATAAGVVVYDETLRKVVDTLWRERTTVAYYYQDTIYVGTVHGLYRLNRKRSIDFLGANVPYLRERISAIARSKDGIVWIGLYGEGVVGYRHDSVVAVFNKGRGLTSDICRNLYLYGQTLWVGTDKGLNRIALDRPGYPITRYTFNDGLGSDIINVVLQDSSVVYVGTPAGLSYFDQSKAVTREGCRLYLLSVLNNGKDRTADTAALVVPFGDRNVQFGFVGISYRSVGDITYRYRMIGLDSVWRTTKQTLLEYPVLPPGNYEFQLEAVNKFGISSETLQQRFIVVTPFWRTIWFEVLVVAVFAFGTWGIANRRIRTIRRRQQERERLNKKMLEIERMALQAQMNPHFIFNCLTSVQQYIVDQDILSANKYITGLARLIRLTLHNSSLAFIRLADEIDYLSAYMSLEKLRFKQKMDYSIEIDPQIPQSAYYIPPMLIQPYIENSIRHGLRHRKAGMGYIRLRIRQDILLDRRGLTVIVEDNGIGRERSAQYKTAEHIEYQSKGMTMTAERIRIINATYGGNIQVKVIDLKDASGEPAGTRVVMQFRIFDHPSQKETL
ncbi:MAG TPA: histidine kinase [Puia sp.]|jgi:ligand-binding sensor domain-containing protein|nr:histidine kinase [Puia sp.]